MLVIRLQRTGRSGHAQYRMVVQDSRRTPTSGKVVALLGNYNPHTKALTFDKDKAQTFLNNGAQPSNRVAMLLKENGINLPDWVVISSDAKGSVKNPDKLRKNRPAEAETPVEEVAEVEAQVEEATEAVAEEPATADEPTEEVAEAAETPAEEPQA